MWSYDTVSRSTLFSCRILIISLIYDIVNTRNGHTLQFKCKIVPTHFISHSILTGNANLPRRTHNCCITILVGTLALMLTAGCGLTEAMFEFASALGTVGLSLGLTGPATGSATLIVEMIGMIMGRLEIFIILTGIYFGLHRVKLQY